MVADDKAAVAPVVNTGAGTDLDKALEAIAPPPDEDVPNEGDGELPQPTIATEEARIIVFKALYIN
ncbi:MAG: hypothetical protein A3F16_05845 [Deltaproteobacteria bacterium RIFCSPHIGHO2_12_FULL_43_9]|nr:MAG: hypothetical protein A3F16_05845 [Deltaproteobacteria bacterium RIFCSPHIGHO2_12_FULL_43_9]